MDALQPAALLNIPGSFMEGAANNSVYKEGGIIKDGFSLSVLSRAKKEGSFPHWDDALGARDIYPTSLSEIAMSSFVAYIIERFGQEKYCAFIKKCGTVNFFKVFKGNFREVYGLTVKEAWKDFEESLPVCHDSLSSTALFYDDTESIYSHITNGKEGIVFYDDAKAEIVKLNSREKKEKLLDFSRVISITRKDAVKKETSESHDRLCISYSTPRHNRDLFKNQAKIYDLETKAFLPQIYPLRNAVIFDFTTETEAVAGFYNTGTEASLKVFPSKQEFSTEELYNLSLPFGCQTEAIIPCGIGKLILVYYFEGKCVLHYKDLFYGTEEFFTLPVRAHDFKLEENLVSFTWTEENSFENGKRGYFLLSDGLILEKLFLQEENFSGGTYDSVVRDEKNLYFTSKRAGWTELKKTEETILKFREEKLLKEEKRNGGEGENLVQTGENPFFFPEWENSQEKIDIGTLNGYQITKYQMYKYSIRGSWLPFFPVSEFDFTKSTLSPGLGASYFTNTDPLENVTGVLSFCTGYIDLKQKTFTTDNNYSLSAFANTTVFPFDVALGSLWKFNEEGEYELKTLLGFEWNTALGSPYNKLTLALKNLWKCSTTYYDWENKEIIEKNGWPSIENAYNTLSINTSATFSNVRQKGISCFEKGGIETSLSFITIYDPQKREKEEEAGYSAENQYTISFEMGVYSPYLIPVFGLENWVICMPFKLSTKWYGENGTSSDSYAEVLLAGYEVQKAIPALNIFCQRLGLKAGYDLNFQYDTLFTEDPDIRNLSGFINVLKKSSLDDYFYLQLEATLSPNIGKFTKMTKVNAGLQFQMHVRKNKGDVKAVLNMLL